MAAFDIAKLVSRTVRAGIGRRTFSAVNHGIQRSSGGNILGTLFSLVTRFVGFILGALWNWLGKFFSWSLSSIWTWITQFTMYLWNFDWNQSDTQLDNSVGQAWGAFGGLLGDFVGYAFGDLVSIGTVAVGMQIFAFDEALAIHVLREMGEDALHQLTSRAAAVINALFPILVRGVAVTCYKQLRNLIGANPSSLYPSDKQITDEIRKLGEANNWNETQIQKTLKQRLDENKKGREALDSKHKPWSFALKYEEWKESIKSDFWRNFADMALQGFSQAVMDQGYVAISAADSYTALHRQAHQIATGSANQYTVEVQFQRSDND